MGPNGGLGRIDSDPGKPCAFRGIGEDVEGREPCARELGFSDPIDGVRGSRLDGVDPARLGRKLEEKRLIGAGCQPEEESGGRVAWVGAGEPFPKVQQSIVIGVELGVGRVRCIQGVGQFPDVRHAIGIGVGAGGERVGFEGADGGFGRQALVQGIGMKEWQGDALTCSRTVRRNGVIGICPIAKQGIEAVDTLGLRGWERGFGLDGTIEGVPQVVGEFERAAGGVGANINHGPDLSCAVVHEVVDKPVVARREEGETARCDGFLQDPEQPMGGFDEGIVGGDTFHGADKRHWSLRSPEDIGEHPDIARFDIGRGLGKRRAKEFEARGPTDIDRARAAVHESIRPDLNVFAAPFALDGVGAHVGEQGVGDDAAMTADVINATAPSAPIAELTLKHDIIPDPRELQSVLIATGTNVAKEQIAEDEVMGRQWIGVGAAVVAIDAIAGGVGDFQVFDDNEPGPSQLQREGTSIDDGARFAGEASEPNGRIRSSSQVCDERAARVGAWQQSDGVARFVARQGPVDGLVGFGAGAISRRVVTGGRDKDFTGRYDIVGECGDWIARFCGSRKTAAQTQGQKPIRSQDSPVGKQPMKV